MTDGANAADHAIGRLRLPEGVGVIAGSPNGARRPWASSWRASTARSRPGSSTAPSPLWRARASSATAIDVVPVPGAFELPLGAMALARTRQYSCVIAIGCVIRGETPHFDYIAAEAASGLQLAALETGIPVSFGVLTCNNREQAEARAGGAQGNKGAEAARSALEMADVFGLLRTRAVD